MNILNRTMLALCTFAVVTHQLSAGSGGSAFGGALGGAFIGSAIGGAVSRPRERIVEERVVVRETPHVVSGRPSNDFRREIDRLKDKIDDRDDKIERLEEKFQELKLENKQLRKQLEGYKATQLDLNEKKQ